MILSADDLTQMWMSAELQSDQLAITYCGAGYFGAFDVFVLSLMEHELAALYDGSWLEWKANPELLVEPCSDTT